MQEVLYRVRGRVLHGKHLGGKLGFPTLNLPLGQDAHPENGVYIALLLTDGKEYWGVLNQGLHPTFPEGQPSIEMHIPDVQLALYDREVEILYLHYLRPERTFAGAQELTEQIAKDIDAMRAYASTRQNPSLRQE